MDYPKLRAHLIQEIGHERYLEIQQTKPANPKDPMPPVHFYEFTGGLSGSNRIDATPRQVDAFRILAFLGAYMLERDEESKSTVEELAEKFVRDWLSGREALGFLEAVGLRGTLRDSLIAQKQARGKAPERHAQVIKQAAEERGINLMKPEPYRTGEPDPTKQTLLPLSGLSEKQFASGWRYLKENSLRVEPETFKGRR